MREANYEWLEYDIPLFTFIGKYKFLNDVQDRILPSTIQRDGMIQKEDANKIAASLVHDPAVPFELKLRLAETFGLIIPVNMMNPATAEQILNLEK